MSAKLNWRAMRHFREVLEPRIWESEGVAGLEMERFWGITLRKDSPVFIMAAMRAIDVNRVRLPTIVW